MASRVQDQSVMGIETLELSEAEEFSMRQHCALRHLAEGKSIAATARLIGMTRASVHNWLRKDPRFAAAFNAWRNELRISTQARLHALCDKAVDALEASLSNRDGKMAMKLLTGMGMIAPHKSEAEDPLETALQNDLDRRRRKLELQSEARALGLNEEAASFALTPPANPISVSPIKPDPIQSSKV